MSDIRRRVDRLEAKLRADGAEEGLTLEQCARLFWRWDREQYRQMEAAYPAFRLWAETFEREDTLRRERDTKERGKAKA